MRTDRKRLRCAIYTRKSSEEGLEQSFNSLDAQREACAAYLESQRHEGWKALATRYDDGGYSGGSMERPALKALLADIDAGKVNVVVVYKVDRLTHYGNFSRVFLLQRRRLLAGAAWRYSPSPARQIASEDVQHDIADHRALLDRPKVPWG